MLAVFAFCLVLRRVESLLTVRVWKGKGSKVHRGSADNAAGDGISLVLFTYFISLTSNFFLYIIDIPRHRRNFIHYVGRKTAPSLFIKKKKKLTTDALHTGHTYRYAGRENRSSNETHKVKIAYIAIFMRNIPFLWRVVFVPIHIYAHTYRIRTNTHTRTCHTRARAGHRWIRYVCANNFFFCSNLDAPCILFISSNLILLNWNRDDFRFWRIKFCIFLRTFSDNLDDINF